MKRFALWMSAAAVLICASHVLAEENEENERQNANTAFISSIDKAVGLTDAQKKTMADITAKRDAAMAEFQTKNVEAMKAAAAALQAAYKSGDKDAIAKANKDYQDSFLPITDLMKKSQADVMNVLTDDQKTKWKVSQLVGMAQRSAGGVTLSDEQIAKLKDSCSDLLKKDSFEGPDWMTIQKNVQAILTPEQKATIEKNQAIQTARMTFGGIWGTAGLTAEQIKELEAAYDELAKTLKGEELRAKLNEKAMSLLTDDQKAAITKNIKNYATMMVKSRYAAAKLTDEQMKQVQAAIDEAAKGSLQLTEVAKKANEKADSLLTDEQKEAMKKANPMTGGAQMPGGSTFVVPGGEGEGHVIILNGQAGGALQVKESK